MIYSIDAILSIILLSIVIGSITIVIPIYKTIYSIKYIKAKKLLYESQFVKYYKNYLESPEAIPTSVPFYSKEDVPIIVEGVSNFSEASDITNYFNSAYDPFKTFSLRTYNCPCYGCAGSNNNPLSYIVFVNSIDPPDVYKYDKVKFLDIKIEKKEVGGNV